MITINNIKKAFQSLPQPLTEYKILTASRRVIKDAKPQQSGYYGSDDFRYEASKILAPFLRKGESVYYEIVGYAGDTSIMSTGDNTSVGDKLFISKFGKETVWSYGCLPGEFKIYIYDWKISNEDGTVQYSYPFEYIKHRCELSGGLLKQVPLLKKYVLVDSEENDFQISRDSLEKVIEELTQDQFSTVAKHLREGVCVRVERNGQVDSTYKNKARSFGITEGYISPDKVNLEELESYQ